MRSLPKTAATLRIVSRLVVLAVFSSACVGNGPSPQVPKSQHAVKQSDDPVPSQTVDRVVVTPNSAHSIVELFAAAERLFAQNDSRAAAQAFDRISELEPEGSYAAPALYNSALAHEKLGDHQAAAQRFAEIPRRFAEHTLAQQSLVRAIRLEVFLEHWKVAGEYAQTLFDRYAALSSLEAIVGYGARAFAHLEEARLDEASHAIEKARQLIDAGRLDSAGRIPRDLAQLYYALGELRRLRGQAVHLEPEPGRFAGLLEQRCQLLLDAQGAYSDVMRAYDAHWSAMAGFRVGELYQELHRELMVIPAPKGVTDERRRLLFEGAMRLRYSVLLEKGLAMMEHTIAMAERAEREEQPTGAGSQDLSAWIARAREARARLKESMAREQETIGRLPYSREELRQALDDLSQKKPTDEADQSTHR